MENRGDKFGYEFAVSPHGVQYLEEKLGTEPMPQFVDLFDNGMVMHEQAAMKVSLSIVQLDRILSKDIRGGAGRAFFVGEAIGLLVAEKFLPEHMHASLGFSLMRNRYKLSGETDPYLQDQHDVRLASDLLENADIGWQLAAEPFYKDYFDRYDLEFEHQKHVRPFVRRGFGFMMYIIEDVWRSDVNKSCTNLTADFDMDEALSELLPTD